MEPRKYCMDDKLIIKSDKDNMYIVLIFGIAVVGLIILWISSFGEADLFWVLMIALLSRMALSEWIGTNRTFIMDKNGCMICFYRYKKFYSWDEFAIKRWENCNPRNGANCTDGYEISYFEGVIFSKYPFEKPKWMSPDEFIVFLRPLTCFCVHFYPYGITGGKGDYKSRRASDTISLRKTIRKPEVYPVEKEVFVNYMKLWDVDIEGLSKDTGHNVFPS